MIVHEMNENWGGQATEVESCVETVYIFLKAI